MFLPPYAQETYKYNTYPSNRAHKLLPCEIYENTLKFSTLFKIFNSNKCAQALITAFLKTRKQEDPPGSGTGGGHLVFGNPALPIPENPKAKHPTPDKIKVQKKHPSRLGQRGSHLVFGSPPTQVPENPKAEHPTPISRAMFYAILRSLTYMTIRKPAQ